MLTWKLKLAAVGTTLAVWLAAGWAGAEGDSGPVVLTTMEAATVLYGRGEYDKALKLSALAIWADIQAPEAPQAAFCLARCFEKLGDKDNAAAFLHILQRLLDEPKFAEVENARIYRQWCKDRLAVLDEDWRKVAEAYRAAAAGRKFVSPDAVGEGWMTNVQADLANLWGLLAWRIIGGRRDKDADWLHNAQGAMHRSGAKYMAEALGRKGLLWGPSRKKAQGTYAFHARNVGKCRFLRAGVRAYAFDLVLRVVVDGQELSPHPISSQTWQDLKIPLGPHAGKDVTVDLEFVVPAQQQAHMGMVVDYVDFFDN